MPIPSACMLCGPYMYNIIIYMDRLCCVLTSSKASKIVHPSIDLKCHKKLGKYVTCMYLCTINNSNKVEKVHIKYSLTVFNGEASEIEQVEIR